MAKAREQEVMKSDGKRRGVNEAPLIGRDGHISLFPVDERALVKAEKNAEAEAEKAKKTRELEDQYTMRFSNAAGKGGVEKPWYAAALSSGRADAADATADVVEEPGKNVWGNADPRRKQREQMRASASDPLAFMSRAQVQLKQSEKDRQKWAEEREREIQALREREARHERRKRHRPRKYDEDGLEGFSLDAAADQRNDSTELISRRHRRSRHEHHRSRSRNGDIDCAKPHRRSRIRSSSCDRDGEGKPGNRSEHCRERASRGGGTLAESLLV